MTTLPNSQLEQLLPILGNLVKAIKAGENVSDLQLEIFLETVSLGDEEWALAEAKKWLRLLKRLIQSNEPEVSKAVEMSLLSIGIPPANVKIALSELSDKQQRESVSHEPEKYTYQKLKVSTEKLSFGQIEVGKSKSLNFFVEGSSGIIENEIECLHFNKTRFRSGREEIIATMSGGHEGEIFFDKIFLKTEHETKVILIQAEFIEKDKEQIMTKTHDGKIDLRIFDIGGSGVKTVKLINNFVIDDINVHYYDKPDWDNFSEWANNNGLLDSRLIGISCAGFIELNGNVKLFRVANWNNKNIISEIQKYSPDSKVLVLNDAESHLMAHYDLFENPQISIVLGTSLGFAISDRYGKIFRPPDNINFDIGEISIPTRASNNKVWWALGKIPQRYQKFHRK